MSDGLLTNLASMQSHCIQRGGQDAPHASSTIGCTKDGSFSLPQEGLRYIVAGNCRSTLFGNYIYNIDSLLVLHHNVKFEIAMHGTEKNIEYNMYMH